MFRGIAVATHAARAFIGQRHPGTSVRDWRGMRSFLAWASAAGFDGIDLSDSVFDFRQPTHDLADLGHLLAEYGLPVPALNCLRASLCDRDYSELSDVRIRAALDAADRLGTEVVNISLAVPPQRLDCNRYRGGLTSPGSSRQASDADFAVTARRLTELVSLADSIGVRLSVEMHHCSIADTSASVLRLIDQVSSPTLGCNPDIINMYWAYSEPEEDCLESLERLAPASNLWHVKNARRILVADGEMAAFIGTHLHSGDVDYRLANVKMHDAGFSGWVSIERAGPGDFLYTAEESLRYLNHLADRAP
jgi:sugar phosphate isomerase/epimerase